MNGSATKSLTLLALCLGLFVTQLDTTVVNLALPSIERSFDGDVALLQWVVDAYNLVFAAFLLTGGLLGDRFGRKRVFLVGLVIFTAGSLVCGTAPSQAILVAGRALQGLGAAIELPGTLAILTATFTDERERARAVATWASMAGFSLAIGPTMGALMIDWFGWESIFLLNLPIGIVNFILASRTIPAMASNRAIGLDLPGQLSFAVALAALTFAAIESPAAGWLSGSVLAFLACALAALAVFVVVERRSARPMMPLALFGIREVATAVIIAGLMTFGMYGFLFIVSLYLQSVRGASALIAGLQLLPMSLSFILVSHLAGRWQTRLGTRWLMVGGMACMGSGLLALSDATPSTGYGLLAAGFVVIGIGLGLNTAPVMGLAVGSAPRDKAGVASGLANAGRLVGATLGVAILGALLPARSATGALAAPAFLDGMRHAFAIGGIGMLAGSAFALVNLRPAVLRRACTLSERSG
jgi:DHA2 family methylenomycin A resistance protein-like MFS transporter